MRSKVDVNLSTIHTTRIFKNMATKIFTSAYSARNEINDVIVPAPAIIGKAKGTTDATLVEPSLIFENFNAKNHFKSHKKQNERSSNSKLINTYTNKT